MQAIREPTLWEVQSAWEAATREFSLLPFSLCPIQSNLGQESPKIQSLNTSVFLVRFRDRHDSLSILPLAGPSQVRSTLGRFSSQIFNSSSCRRPKIYVIVIILGNFDADGWGSDQ